MKFDQIPSMSQRQDSVSDQLRDLVFVANRLGMYDAADAVNQIFPMLGELKYGCHIEAPEEIDEDCVLDHGRPDDCVCAKMGMRREQCEYWRVM